MQTQKTIFVTGATGNQGGAVARNLISNGFKLKVLTRNPGSTQATKLIHENVEFVKGDLNEPASFKDQLKGIDGIFSVQTFIDGIKKEIRQGTDLANLAKEYNVGFFLYSSVSGAHLHTGIPHWESKLVIENHIKSLSIPYAILRPTSLYENFLIPQVKSRLLKGKLVYPIDKNVVQQFVASEDIGKISARIFENPGQYVSKTIALAAEQLDLLQVAGIFSNIWGKEIKCQKLPAFITRLAMGHDLYTMFNWINKQGGDLIEDLEKLKKENPNLITLEQWIRTNFKESKDQA